MAAALAALVPASVSRQARTRPARPIPRYRFARAHGRVGSHQKRRGRSLRRTRTRRHPISNKTTHETAEDSLDGLARARFPISGTHTQKEPDVYTDGDGDTRTRDRYVRCYVQHRQRRAAATAPLCRRRSARRAMGYRRRRPVRRFRARARALSRADGALRLPGDVHALLGQHHRRRRRRPCRRRGCGRRRATHAWRDPDSRTRVHRGRGSARGRRRRHHQLRALAASFRRKRVGPRTHDDRQTIALAPSSVCCRPGFAFRAISSGKARR